MVEHFRRGVMHRLGGRAHAMVVTSSRLDAVRYKLAFDRYLAENGYANIRPLVAFSGKVRDAETGIEYLPEPWKSCERRELDFGGCRR